MTTTLLDIVMLNDTDRFHLVIGAIDRLGSRASGLGQQTVDERLRHRAIRHEVGDDPGRCARLDVAGSGRSVRATMVV